MLFARMGLRHAAWDLSSSEYSYSPWIVFVCERSSYRPEEAWQLRGPFKLPHQRLIELLLDFNVKAANLAACFCLGLRLMGLSSKASAVFCLHVTWKFDLYKLSFSRAGSLVARDVTNIAVNMFCKPQLQ